MVYRDLHDFLRRLEEAGELLRIEEPVSAELEITEIADRVVKRGGPALLFENVEGKDFPLVINLYGTARRMAWALGVEELEELPRRLRDLLDIKLGQGLLSLASHLPKLRELKTLAPRRVRGGLAQEVVLRGDEVDLSRLPILKCWPLDGGPFITLPLVITRDPIEGDVNIGMYRMQVYDRNTTAMHWQRHKVGARHLENARKLGKRLEVAVALGGDPALTYAATAPIPPIPGVNEFSLTGYLRGRPVELTKGVTVDLEVPANAEFILEGYIDPEEEWRVEGPFGDHTGFYTLEDLYPAFHVTAVTMRRNPVYPATIVGKPPMEDAYLIEATERIFSVPAQLVQPELVDYHLPPAGIAHNLVNVTIRKSFPGHAYKVANGLLGLGQMMLAKVILVTDEDVDVRDHLGFWRAVLRNAVPGRDQQIAKGPIDVLDHSSRSWSYGSKLVIDGTVKHEEEGGQVDWQPNPERMAKELPSHAEIFDQYQFEGGIWVITTKKDRPLQGRHVGEWAARQSHAKGVRLIAVVDADVNPANFEETIWSLLNNIDPERDLEVVEGDAGRDPVWVLDGTQKLESEGFDRPWPPKIEMTEEIRRRVDERFGHLFEAPSAAAETPVSASGTRQRAGKEQPE